MRLQVSLNSLHEGNPLITCGYHNQLVPKPAFLLPVFSAPLSGHNLLEWILPGAKKGTICFVLGQIGNVLCPPGHLPIITSGRLMFSSWWLSKGGGLLQGSNESAATAPLRTSCGCVCDGPAPVRAIHTLECSIFTAQIFSLVIIASSGDLKWPGLVTSSWCLQGEEGKRQTRPEGILKDGGNPCVLLYFLSRTKEPPCLSLASCLSCVNKSEASTSYSEGAENF